MGLAAACRSCSKQITRIRLGMASRGRPYAISHRGKPGPSTLATHCKRGHDLSEEAYLDPKTGRRHCRACQRIRSKREDQRERHRIYQEGQRRRAGAAQRIPRVAAPKDASEYLTLDAEPFASWLDEHVDENDLRRWTKAHGIDESNVKRLRDRKQQRVHIDTVDTVLTRHGGTFLFDLYPDLYPGLTEATA